MIGDTYVNLRHSKRPVLVLEYPVCLCGHVGQALAGSDPPKLCTRCREALGLKREREARKAAQEAARRKEKQVRVCKTSDCHKTLFNPWAKYCPEHAHARAVERARRQVHNYYQAHKHKCAARGCKRMVGGTSGYCITHWNKVGQKKARG